jgi:hypothetical protein
MGFSTRSVGGRRLETVDSIPENNVWCTRWEDDRINDAFAAQALP